MPAISLGFGEVEERLEQIRRRLNSLSLQRVAYLSGTPIVLLGALLVVVALRAPPHVFHSYLAGYLLIACAIASAAVFRLRERWLSLEGVARLADREASLDSRLSTLCAQRSRPQRSRLGGVLLVQTLALGPRWDRSALAPRRDPPSVYLLLISLALFWASWFVPPQPAESSIAGDSTSASSPKDESDTAHEQVADTNALSRTGSKEGSAGIDGKGTGVARSGESPPQAGQHSDPESFDDSSEPGRPGKEGMAKLANADAGQQSQTLGSTRNHNKDGSEVQNSQGETHRDTPDSDKRPAADPRPAAAEDKPQPDRRAKQEQDPGKRTGDEKGRSEAQMESATAKGGSKPSGKIGGAVNDPLYENGEAPAARHEEAGKPGTFALRLTGVAASVPASFEPQGQRPPDGGQQSGMGQGPSPQTGLAEQQVEDDPLRKAQISPEHESLLQRIFRHD